MKPIQIASTPLRSTLWLLLFSLAAPAASLVNNFTTPYDYVNNGIIGETNWDGIYMNLGDIPNNNNAGGNGAGATTVANSAVTYPGYLGLQSLGTDWAGGDNDGLFVWKLVQGDFDVSVQSSPFTLSGGTWYDSRGANFCGLMVRAYKPDNSGAPYSPNTTNFVENYVQVLRMNQFGFSCEVNEATDGIRREHTYAPPDANSDTNSNVDSDTNCYSDCDCDRIAAGYADASASTDTAAARGELLL